MSNLTSNRPEPWGLNDRRGGGDVMTGASDADELERQAKEARRRADIAKHRPLPIEDLDRYGEDQCRDSSHAQIDLMRLASELQNAYAAELERLWHVIKTLRAEALYWRQRCEQHGGPGLDKKL